MRRLSGLVAALCGLLLAACDGGNAPVTVAVASNFAPAAEKLAQLYEAQSGTPVRLVTGSTGQLYAQAKNGAPYDVLLGADEARPRRLEEEGLAVAGFTYAIGRLCLYSADPTRISIDGVAALTTPRPRRLAMANPALAPYGAASAQVLARLQLDTALADAVVLGENIAQAFALVQTGNAELGFVAAAQLVDIEGGSRWYVPASLHEPIRQRAVLLARGADRPAAKKFFEFLRSADAEHLIVLSGYEVES